MTNVMPSNDLFGHVNLSVLFIIYIDILYMEYIKTQFIYF